MRTIPPALLEKINKRHQTIYENADPKLKVLLSKGFNKELFRVYTIHDKENIAEIDVTAMRSQSDSEPDKIYVAYIENGVAHVKSKPLPYDELVPWTYEFELGTATNVAIDFDGYWDRPLGETRFNLVADEYPWIFRLNSGVLTAQYWQNTAVEISSNVSKIRSVKGWVPANGDETNDQGLIIYYLKTDGTVWYRNYAIQGAGAKEWEVERQITEFTGTVSDIALFRTNDFRVGFLVQNSDDTIEYVITERNWSGMSFEPEIFKTPVKVSGITFEQLKKIITIHDEQPVEVFSNPPTVTNQILYMCTVEENESLCTVTNIDWSYGGYTITYTLDFIRDLEFNVSKEDFIINGIDSVFTVLDVTLVSNIITITLEEPLPITGFIFKVNSGQFKAYMSNRCGYRYSIGDEILIDAPSNLAIQEDTFNNVIPSISSLTFAQLPKIETIHDEQPVETFNNPLSVSGLTFTILDVNGNPL